MPVEPDLWLAGILGQDVYRLSWDAASPDLPDSVQAVQDALTASGGRPAFYYAKLPTQAVAQVRRLCDLGFFVVDVSLTFERPPQRDPALPAEAGIVVQDLCPEFQAAVLDIARHCFSYSRFHLDPFLAREQADRIKSEWVRNCLLGRRGERTLVAASDGVPVGFLAVLAAEVKGRSCRIIDLMGVAPSCQGRGVGARLVSHFIQAYTGECDLLRVGTQAANTAAVRLYERCGFRLVESAYVLHAHVDNRKRLP